jgi:hypothetical protein
MVNTFPLVNFEVHSPPLSYFPPAPKQRGMKIKSNFKSKPLSFVYFQIDRFSQFPATMEVISCGQSTKLTSFENCTLLAEEHKHPNQFNSDIQYFSKDLFLLTHKSSNIELIKICRGNVCKIEQIKKLKIDNLYCSAPQKKNKSFAAIGTIDGIRILNLKNNRFEKKLSECFPGFPMDSRLIPGFFQRSIPTTVQSSWTIRIVMSI